MGLVSYRLCNDRIRGAAFGGLSAISAALRRFTERSCTIYSARPLDVAVAESQVLFDTFSFKKTYYAPNSSRTAKAAAIKPVRSAISAAGMA